MKNGGILGNQILNRLFQFLILVALLFCFTGVSDAGQEKLDPVAVEQTLKAWSGKYPLVKMIGVNQISETSATVYYVIKAEGSEFSVSGDIQYLIDKGWFLIRAKTTNNNVSWAGIFEKIERKE